MKCSRCKTPLRRGVKFCPKCGTKVKHTARNLMLVILSAVILLGGAGIAGWQLGLFSKTESGLNESITQDITLLSGSFSDRIIVDQVSALAAISDVADVLGISDVNEEFPECREDTVFGNTYYRFYQEYEGIPVYGRSVVVAADVNGSSLLLSGNYVAVDDVKLIPTVVQQDIIIAIEKYVAEDLGFTTADLDIEAASDELLCIYNMGNDNEAHLSYNLQVSGTFSGAYEFIVDAHNAEVLAAVPELYETTSFKASDTERENGFETVYTDGEYLMLDPYRKLCVFSLNNEVSNYIAKDSSGKTIKDENGKDLVITQWGKGEFLTSANNIFGDTLEEQHRDYETGAQLLITVSEIYDFYQDFGFANEIPVWLYYQDGYDNGNNALGGLIREDIGVISMGTNTGVDCVDVIAHEFTHFVSRRIVQWNSDNEASSLNEAISDVMGELFEAEFFDSEPDWIMSTYRSIQSPSGNYILNYEDYKDDLDCHYASTIVSHAAYLMWLGDDQNGYTPLTTQDLEQLFYTTLYSMPANCTFQQFRALLENTAEIMYAQGVLTKSQQECVSYAMGQTGIAPTQTICYIVAENLSLSVYDINREKYDNYAVTTTTVDVVQGPGVSSPVKEIKTTYEANQPLELVTGKTYHLTVTDLENDQNSVVCFIRSSSSGVNEISLYTDFGKLEKAPVESTNGNLSDVSSVIDVLLENEDMWNGPFGPEALDYGMESWFAYFMDFDFDGVPEFVVESPMMGSGRFTYRTVYQVQGKNLVAVQYPYESDSDWDTISLMRNKGTGEYFYVGEDYARGGAEWYSDLWSRIDLRNGQFIVTDLYSLECLGGSFVYHGSDYSVDISKSEFDQLQDNFQNDNELLDSPRGTIIDEWNVNASEAEKRAILLEAYESVTIIKNTPNMEGEVAGEYPNQFPVPTGQQNLLSDIKERFGIASSEKFVSSMGPSDMGSFPDQVFGYISGEAVDLDNDGTDELLVLRSVDGDEAVRLGADYGEPRIVAEVYQIQKDQIVLSASEFVGELSYSEGSNIYLFYSEELKQYCIVYDYGTWGSYTGINVSGATTYIVTADMISLYSSWGGVPFFLLEFEEDDVEEELLSIGAPYAEYSASIDDRSNASYFKMLCKILHDGFNVSEEDAITYNNGRSLGHTLQIVGDGQ